MREIKFRGKRLDNGEWVFGDLHLNTPYPHIHYEFCHRAKIDTKTIGQFTGMRDKNGKEIYEGDIVKWVITQMYVDENGGYKESDSDEIDVIEWHNDALYLGEYCAVGFTYESEDYADIIGNIHDNPELLESL